MRACFALNSPGMRRFVWIWIAAYLFLAVACQGPGGELRGATPVGYIRPVINPLTDTEAEPVTIAELSESPEDFEDKLLEVTGVYYKRPVVICSTRFQLSPAQWALSDGEVRIPAAGLDERLEELPSGRIEMTVFGRMIHWQGPVGCGRQSQVTEVWYLEVLEIISPNPITIAAVGPGGGGVSIESVPAETGGYPGPTGTGEGDEPQVSATGIVSGTGVSEIPSPIGTPVLATPSPTSGVSGGYPGPGSGSTITSPTPPTGGTNATPTPTSSAPAATPTTTNGSPVPTATSGGGGNEPVTVDQEELPLFSIETGELQTNEVHRWPFVITSTAVITVNVASQLGLDVGIAIRDPSGNIIAEQNKSQDNAPEVLAAVSLTELGTYDILVTSENGESGYYAILILDDATYTVLFNGTIEAGQSETIDLRENNDHFWHFVGTAGDTVTIRITPSDNGDFFILLYGVDGVLVVDFYNETGAGEVEELLSFTLPATGMYSIHLGEFNYGASNYTISLLSG